MNCLYGARWNNYWIDCKLHSSKSRRFSEELCCVFAVSTCWIKIHWIITCCRQTVFCEYPCWILFTMCWWDCVFWNRRIWNHRTCLTCVVSVPFNLSSNSYFSHRSFKVRTVPAHSQYFGECPNLVWDFTANIAFNQIWTSSIVYQRLSWWRSSNKKEESVKCLRVDKIQGQVVNAPNILRATARPTMHLERCFNLIQFMVFKTCQVNELLSVTMGCHALRALCFCELATWCTGCFGSAWNESVKSERNGQDSLFRMSERFESPGRQREKKVTKNVKTHTAILAARLGFSFHSDRGYFFFYYFDQWSSTNRRRRTANYLLGNVIKQMRAHIRAFKCRKCSRAVACGYTVVCGDWLRKVGEKNFNGWSPK